MLLTIFCGNYNKFSFQDFSMNKVNSIYFCKFFSVTFDQFNPSLLIIDIKFDLNLCRHEATACDWDPHGKETADFSGHSSSQDDSEDWWHQGPRRAWRLSVVKLWWNERSQALLKECVEPSYCYLSFDTVQCSTEVIIKLLFSDLFLLVVTFLIFESQVEFIIQKSIHRTAKVVNTIIDFSHQTLPLENV